MFFNDPLVGSTLIIGCKDKSHAKFTIMIPTYERPDLLKEAVNSALAQKTSIDFHVIVVDNSQDEEISKKVNSVISSFNADNLYLYRNDENIGMRGNWNRCVEICKTKFFTLLNDDDLLSPRFIESISPLMRANTSMISTGQIELDQREGVISRRPSAFKEVLNKFLKSREICKFDLYIENIIGNSAGVVLNKELLIKAGYFDIEYYPSFDYDTWIKMCDFGTVYMVRERLASYRISVNESLNPEVLSGFVEQDRRLRERYFSSDLNHLDRMIVNSISLRDIAVYKEKWGVDLMTNFIHDSNCTLLERLISRSNWLLKTYAQLRFFSARLKRRKKPGCLRGKI